MALIEFHDVHKWYGDFHVLKGITESVDTGEVLVICGPSGSGKSTLIRCVNRLEEYQKGHILIDGKDIHGDDIDVNELRSHIGIVFQQFNLYPHLSVIKNITLAPMKVKKISRTEAEKIAMALLERVGIHEQAHKYPAELSGGQQQRVAIARALAMKPRHHALRRADLGTRPGDDQRGLKRHEGLGPRRHDHAVRDPRDGVRPRGGRPGGVHGLRGDLGAGSAPGIFQQPQTRAVQAFLKEIL
jgi:ABC-type ATPase involved in cell division